MIHVLVTAHLLRRHIAECANGGTNGGKPLAARARNSRNAKVHQLDPTVRINQHVAGFDVTVHYGFFVHIVQRFQQVLQNQRDAIEAELLTTL